MSVSGPSFGAQSRFGKLLEAQLTDIDPVRGTTKAALVIEDAQGNRESLVMRGHAIPRKKLSQIFEKPTYEWNFSRDPGQPPLATIRMRHQGTIDSTSFQVQAARLRREEAPFRAAALGIATGQDPHYIEPKPGHIPQKTISGARTDFLDDLALAAIALTQRVQQACGTLGGYGRPQIAPVKAEQPPTQTTPPLEEGVYA